MNIKTKALLSLLGTVLLFSVLVIAARATVNIIDPISLLFFRLSVAAVCFLPFFLNGKPWRRQKFNRLITVSVFSWINVTFFLIGIQYTSASASQLIYAAIPIILIIIGKLFYKEVFSNRIVLGVLTGFSGLFLLVFFSLVENGTTINGSAKGNFIIAIAMLGWMLYILFSKKLGKYFSPIDIGSTSVIVSFLLSIPLFSIRLFQIDFQQFNIISILPVAFYMGFFGTFLTYILYQYGLKHTSALTTSLTTYLQPVVTAFLEIIFLGEKLTFPFLFGSLLVLGGIFISTTLELLSKKVSLN